MPCMNTHKTDDTYGTARLHGRERNAAGQLSGHESPTRVQRELREALPDHRPEFVPEGVWETLVLHVGDGLSYEAIARRWGSSPNKPKYRAKKGLDLLMAGGKPEREVPEPYKRGDRVYGEMGMLQGDGERLVCHICGRAYAGLGQHVRMRHGMSADEYREEFGLMQKTGLISDSSADKRREQVSHLRAYDTKNAQMMRDWDGASRRRWGKRREVRPQQKLDPGYQARLEESVSQMHEGLARAREEGRFTEPGWSEKATRSGQRALAQKRKDPAFREEVGRAISESKGGVSKETRYCAVCGEPFEHTAWMNRLTCSEGCSKELRRQRMVRDNPSKQPEARQKIAEKAARRSSDRERDNRGRYV